MKKILFICVVLGIFTISAVAASSDIRIITEGTQWDKYYGEFHDVDITKMDGKDLYHDTKVKATGIIQTEAGGVSLLVDNGTTHKKLKLDQWLTTWKDGDNVTLYGHIINTDLHVEAVKYND